MAKKKLKIKKKRTAMFSCLTRMKSAILSIHESMVSVYKIYEDFCNETTLHGLKHTVEDKLHWFERFLWLILTVCAFTGAVYCALSQYNRYNSEPIVVSMQRDYRGWWTAFPSITACYLDRVQPDRAREIIERIWNVTEESDAGKYQYYYDLVVLVADVSFRENLQNFWKYQADDTVIGVDLLQIALYVHPAMELRVAMSQKKSDNFKVIWHPVMTEVGMCLTFNSQYAKYQHMLTDEEWHPTELFRCHYLSGQCFVRIDSSDSAVRYFIHSPYEISTAISNPTGEISPGEELIIDFKAVEIEASPSVKELRPVQRRCHYPDEKLGDSIKAYSFALCQMHCRSRMAVMFCGCRPYFHVKGVLPFGLDVGLLATVAYYMTGLSRADDDKVRKVFGPEPWSKDDVKNQEEVVHCIAHRGAALDAPENTIEAFKYCVEQNCKFVELDVRSLRDGRLVLLHDPGLQRLTGSSITNVRYTDWDAIRTLDVAANHPNRQHFKDVHLCLLDDALDYLLENKVRIIIDVKGEDNEVVSGVLKAFATRPTLYENAAITCFNPYLLYMIRRRDPKIIGAISYRPYCFSSQNYDAENGPTNPRYPHNLPLQTVLRLCDVIHSVLWRWSARWCGVSAVFVHKDIVSPREIEFWRNINVRCIGWSVNRPVEKLYWRGVLKAPYLANTLLGEPISEKQSKERHAYDRATASLERILEPERNISSGQN